jgi:hypothetical protein
MNAEFTTLFVWVVLASSIAFARRQERRSLPVHAIALRYNGWFQCVGWLLAIFINAVTLTLYLRAPGGEASQIATTPLLILNLMCLWLVLETTFVTVLISEQGILMRSPWKKTRHIDWSQVADIKYSDTTRWWTVRSQSGTQIHVANRLIGAHRFVELASRFAPAHLRPALAA